MYSTVRIQVQLIQYPGTTGMGHIDHLVADHIAWPPEYATEHLLSEKLALLQATPCASRCACTQLFYYY